MSARAARGPSPWPAAAPRLRAGKPREPVAAAARAGRVAGFTLVEVLVALAIMAVGTTAAIGLFTAATAMHKRALDQTTAALLADAALAEARASVTLAFDAGALEAARPASGADPPVLYLRRGAANPSYPGYTFDVLLTPVGTSDLDEADAFHAEVHVRWNSTNRVRTSDFQTVILRRVTVRDVR